MIMDKEVTVLAGIYDNNVNLAIWQRETPEALSAYAVFLLSAFPGFDIRTVVKPAEIDDLLSHKLPEYQYKRDFIADVTSLCEMFCDLFDLKQLGLRLGLVDTAMCPRFHTDHLPCRLVTTYIGAGSQWLVEPAVDRSKLGAGANGLPDHASGIYLDEGEIRQLQAGEVALLKGTQWAGNEQTAIVHRSPHIAAGDKRLLLTLDFAD
ncbi:DUF1826 domain-containing protein [Methylophaga sp. OBS4]|uniref:DUF1826 domain-containing protein n=1 Tax=Methylophaga sp. OBS4 TaxID=2991935 RepID=UPI00225603CA|nr:DUF1826 domain-containing protein [Methylophaga sp. OBS4]MCX4186973.1 DUF1826 domain-containing protein [Methylophaga sp. OBS4]